MKYIYKALEFSQQNLGLLTLFIIINLAPLLVTLLKSTENKEIIINSFLYFLAYLFSIFLLSGTYSMIWQRFKNEPTNFSLLIPESKKYFCNFLGVNIVIAILGLIVAVASGFCYEQFFYKNVVSVDFYSTSEFATIISISFYLILGIYCYALPYLYVKRLNSKKAILITPKIFIKYKYQSVPIIILLFINMLITFLHPENPVESWQTTILVNVIILYIYFYIFLVACQILDEIEVSNI